MAVVTSGTRGTGFEVCRRLFALGFTVVLGATDLREAELAAKEIDPAGERVSPRQIEPDNSVNIAELGSWVKQRFGRLDALVNNHSSQPDRWAMAGNTDLSPVAEALDVNLFGAWRVTQALLPLLRSSPRARIVNVTSEDGSISRMSGGRPAYSVSMAALNALTKLLAGELYRDGVLVNAVNPGVPAGGAVGNAAPADGTAGGTAGGKERTVAQGAASIVWAVTLPNGGATGTLTRDGKEVPW